MPSLFPKPKPTSKSGMSFGMLLIVVIVIMAGLLRLVGWLNPPAVPTLLTQAQGLVRLSSLEEVGQYVATHVKEPENTFGATLHVIGVYTQETPEMSTNSVSLVYIRDGFRFVELNIQPNNTVQKILSLYGDLVQEQVVLSKDTYGTLVTMRDQSSCHKPSEAVIGMCQITRALMFEHEGQTFVLYADGTHPTNGELIEMARSIVDEGSLN